MSLLRVGAKATLIAGALLFIAGCCGDDGVPTMPPPNFCIAPLAQDYAGGDVRCDAAWANSDGECRYDLRLIDINTGEYSTHFQFLPDGGTMTTVYIGIGGERPGLVEVESISGDDWSGAMLTAYVANCEAASCPEQWALATIEARSPSADRPCP